jgi:poly(ADP-ribose) glycohydrolase ARH3
MPTEYNRPAAFSLERLAGAALGTMCGDALGMPVEGWEAQAIKKEFGRLDSMQPGRLPAGSYTDDSQMMIAILETLAHKGRFDGPDLAQRFVDIFDPRRGYGGRIHGVMQRLADGAAWDQAGTDSFGNGGAMRVGVLGAFYAEDEEALTEAALDQCRITHNHPQGLAGALAQALAVGLACRWGAQGQERDAAEMAGYLADRVRGVDAHTAGRLERLAGLPRDEAAAAEFLIAEYARDVTAAEAVPPAVGAFLAAESAGGAISLAVSLGGDTDTIGCMAGAMAGAFWGLEALPAKWLEALENGKQGRDWALGLCVRAVEAKNELTNRPLTAK